MYFQAVTAGNKGKISGCVNNRLTESWLKFPDGSHHFEWNAYTFKVWMKAGSFKAGGCPEKGGFYSAVRIAKKLRLIKR